MPVVSITSEYVFLADLFFFQPPIIILACQVRVTVAIPVSVFAAPVTCVASFESY